MGTGGVGGGTAGDPPSEPTPRLGLTVMVFPLRRWRAGWARGGGPGVAAGSPTHGRRPTGPPWGWAVPGAALGTPLGGGRRGWHCGGRRWRCG